MNTPREPDDRDDELLAAYHRASAQEGRAPAPEMRERILAQVRRDHAPAAANDSRWRARAAAGVAVLGLVGWLAVHELRDAPRQTDVMVNAGTVAPATAPSAAAAPAAVTAPPEQHSVSARAQYSAPATAPAAAEAEVSTETLVASAASSAGAARMSMAKPQASAAQADSLQRAAAPRAVTPRVLAPGDEAQVRRAVSAQFAGLFLPRDSDHLNRVMVLMDWSGNIVRSAVESAPASATLGEQPGAPEDFQSLGLRTEDITAPGFMVLVENAVAAGTPDRVLLVRYAWTRLPGQ
jgi:hypothetical protein